MEKDRNALFREMETTLSQRQKEYKASVKGLAAQTFPFRCSLLIFVGMLLFEILYLLFYVLFVRKGYVPLAGIFLLPLLLGPFLTGLISYVFLLFRQRERKRAFAKLENLKKMRLCLETARLHGEDR